LTVSSYRTIAGCSEGSFTDKGSRFIGLAYPVTGEEEVKQILKDVRGAYKGARHFCYAFTLGSRKELSRSNDDGEPSGTAGKPISGQIVSFDVTDTLVIVVRYFGGVLLGTGGLIQAYKAAAKEALQRATIIEKEIREKFSVSCSYEKLPALLAFMQRKNIAFNYGSTTGEKAEIVLDIRPDEKKELERDISVLLR
jgi:uncharacterized YigZ family protein